MSVQSDPVLILGGGLIGLAVAHQLARRGELVQVLSRRRSEAAGFVAAGMLAPHAEGLSGPLLALGQASLARIPAWVAQIESDSGLSCGLRPCGIVVPFASAEQRDAYPTAPFGTPLTRRRAGAGDPRHRAFLAGRAAVPPGRADRQPPPADAGPGAGLRGAGGGVRGRG